MMYIGLPQWQHAAWHKIDYATLLITADILTASRATPHFTHYQSQKLPDAGVT